MRHPPAKDSSIHSGKFVSLKVNGETEASK
jgi:hypothetical protein